MQGLGSGITLGIADRLPQVHGVGKSHLLEHGLGDGLPWTVDMWSQLLSMESGVTLEIVDV